MSTAKTLRVLSFRSSGDVQRVIDAYLRAIGVRVRAGSLSKIGLDQATHYLGDFAKAYGGKSIADCRSTDLVEWICDHPGWVSPHTKIDAVKHVVGAFNWAHDEGMIPRKPYKRPKGMWDSPEPRTAMSLDEYQAIQQIAKKAKGPPRRRRLPSIGPFRCAMFFLWHTGSRTCEMREADVTHYHPEANMVILPPSKHKTGRKTGKPRLIPLEEAGRLVRWLCRGRTSGRIFRNSWGRPWTKDSFGKLFRKFAELAGVREEVTGYCTRHGFTCIRKANGADSLQLAHVLGQTTSRYVETVYGKSLLQDADYLNAVAKDMKRKK